LKEISKGFFYWGLSARQLFSTTVPAIASSASFVGSYFALSGSLWAIK